MEILHYEVWLSTCYDANEISFYYITMTPYDEAVRILAEVIKELTAPNRDLLAIVRKCQHICEIVNWDSQKIWFQQELSGYYSTVHLPAYRKIPGQLIWEPKGSGIDQVYWDTNSFMGDVQEEDITEENITIDIREGLDWIIKTAKFGYKNPTGQTKDYWLGSKTITLHRVEISWRAKFSHLMAEIERRTFDFASRAYVQLNYGNAISGIWADYRKIVDEGLQQLNMNRHLETIQKGLASENPESWRVAVNECRNIFEDMANYLWQDPRKTYKYLPGRDTEGKPQGELEVKKGLFKNQLRAYIHQKGLGEKNRKFIQAEIDRLADSISSLISLQSKAHQSISRQDALSIAIATYVILGELIIRTDMQPLKEYAEPVKGTDIE